MHRNKNKIYQNVKEQRAIILGVELRVIFTLFKFFFGIFQIFNK